MSECSSSIAVNSEWETMSQCLSEMGSDVDSEGTNTDDISNKQDEFKPLPWMTEEMEEIRNLTSLMKAKTVQVYRIILVLENVRQEFSCRIKRRGCLKSIHMMEDICQKYSSWIITTNEENMKAIEQQVKSTSDDISLKESNSIHINDYEEKPSTFKPSTWMQSEIEQVAESAIQMEEKMYLLYKKIVSTESARAASKSRSERAVMASEVLELEKLSGKVSSAIKGTTEKNIRSIEEFMRGYTDNCTCPNCGCLGE